MKLHIAVLILVFPTLVFSQVQNGGGPLSDKIKSSSVSISDYKAYYLKNTDRDSMIQVTVYRKCQTCLGCPAANNPCNMRTWKKTKVKLLKPGQKFFIGNSMSRGQTSSGSGYKIYHMYKFETYKDEE